MRVVCRRFGPKVCTKTPRLKTSTTETDPKVHGKDLLLKLSALRGCEQGNIELFVATLKRRRGMTILGLYWDNAD